MPKKRSNFQAKIELYAVRAIIGAVGLFSLKTSMKIGEKTGKYLARLFPKFHKTANRNLEIAFPQMSAEEKAKMVSGCLENLGRQLGLVSHFRKFTHEDVRNLVEIKGREYFDKAHDSERGVLFFTGHFGSWEVFNLLPPAFGYAMNILVRRIDNPLVENFVDSLRTRFGSITIDKTKSAKAMFRMLKNGEKLGIVADLNAQEREGVFVDFFGVPASTTTSVARLALRTNSIVIPVFAVWDEKKQKYIVDINPPLEIAEDETVEGLTQRVTKVIENYVRLYPEQWMWIHKRWNTRPPGEPLIY